jgi:predicted DNA-binding protein
MMYDPYIMKRTQIYLDTDQDLRLADRARTTGVTKSTLIREAIETYLAKPDQDAVMTEFRDALDRLAARPLDLPDGESYVEELRARDIARLDAIDERR